MMAAMAPTRRADMFTADGQPSDDDPREHGPRLGDERATLAEALRRQRLTLEIKCAGLDAEAMARRSVEPLTMSLLGLVRHLADIERMDFATRFVVGAASLDITADDPLNQHGSGGGPMSLREVLVGVIEEYARHNGHADLLLERIDGRIGQ
jgi:hypothetical protein